MLTTTAMLTIGMLYFDKIVNEFPDFNYYVTNPTSFGPNLGYRWIIYLLGIENINEITPIFLATSLNLIIDILWICLVLRHLENKALLTFVFLLALQPYVAMYTLKFSSIIFAKMGVLYFFWSMERNRTDVASLSMKNEAFFWIAASLIRNSNIIIFIFILIWRLRKNFSLMLLSVAILGCIFYFITRGYLEGINPSNWPWNYTYVQKLFTNDNAILTVILLGTSKLFLLFGAREKVFTEGVEPFINSGVPTIELLVYFVLALMQIVGIIYSVKFFYKKHSLFSLIVYVPLLLSLITVAHARYLIPYVPVCMFGLALIINKKEKVYQRE